MFSITWGICFSLPNRMKTYDSCTVRAQFASGSLPDSGQIRTRSLRQPLVQYSTLTGPLEHQAGSRVWVCPASLAACQGGVLMGFSRCQLPLLLLSTLLTSSVHAMAQDQATLQESPSTATNKKERKREKKLARELGSAYDSWLKEDVPDIITNEERRAFLQLSTNEEREQFVESFWDRRNPDPESANTYKEEHYRRLAYADERFASGIPGRKTDRGHIYVLWGPPDEIESHPTGGTYDRPIDQGGGSTTTYPWELWRYRHLEGVGENIEIEFVDPSGSGEY